MVFGVPLSTNTPSSVIPAPSAPTPIAPVASQPTTTPKRETPPPPVDDLDTPGDLFTEPTPRKH